MKRRRWRAILILFVVGLAGTAGYFFLSARPVAVSVVEAAANVPIRVFGLGTVEARIVSRTGFEVSAAIVELTADHGDTVVTGDILARLDATEQDARVARAAASVLGAEVNVHKAEANVARARAILAQKRDTNQRKQALVGGSIVSRQSADEARRDEDIAAAELTVAQAEVDVAKAFVTDATAALAYEQAVLAKHVLTAPFDAVVVERHSELGTVVKAGDVIYTLMDPKTVWVLGYVDEALAGAIAEGQSAEVQLRSLPQQTFPAQVVRIGIESDRVNEERRIWVKCTQCPPRFHLGEQAQIRITVATLDNALLVPEIAVSGFDGHTGKVWIVHDGRLSQIRLGFGNRSEDARLEVVDGLPDGARIVAAIVPRLKEGRAATIAESARP